MNRKFDLNDFINSLNKEEFEQFYRTHSNKIILKQYNINVNNLRKILFALNIKIKTKEEINKIISNTFLNKYDEEKELLTKQRLQTRSKWSDEYKEELSKKQSEIRKNFTEEQKKHQVEAFRNTQSSKTPEQRAIEKSHRSEATKLHYQSLSEDEKKAFSEKMKQVYAELPDDVKENRKNKIRDTYRKTCRERYGVDNMFQLEEIKKNKPVAIDDKADRYREEGISEKEIDMILQSQKIGTLLDETIALGCNPKDTAAWILTDCAGILRKNGQLLSDLTITADDLATIIKMVDDNTVNRPSGRKILTAVLEEGVDPVAYCKEQGIDRKVDNSLIESIVDKVVSENADAVDYKCFFCLLL